MPTGKALTEAQVLRLREMWAAGVPTSQILAETGLSRPTLVRVTTGRGAYEGLAPLPRKAVQPPRPPRPPLPPVAEMIEARQAGTLAIQLVRAHRRALPDLKIPRLREEAVRQGALAVIDVALARVIASRPGARKGLEAWRKEVEEWPLPPLEGGKAATDARAQRHTRARKYIADWAEGEAPEARKAILDALTVLRHRIHRG